MYEDNTDKLILDRMLDKIPNNINKLEGGFTYDTLSPVAQEFMSLYSHLDWLLQVSFPQSAYGEYLDNICENKGVKRKLGKKATGNLTFIGSESSFIAKGSIFQTQDGLQFKTLNTGIIPSSKTTTVGAEAIDIGSKYNVKKGLINKSLVVINGINSITNNFDFTGGTDTETDDELRERYFFECRKNPTSGNIADYIKWAKEVEGILTVNVKPLWAGNSTVKVIVGGLGGKPVDSTIISNVKKHIEEERPIGADVTVISTTALPVNINIKGLALDDGFIIDVVIQNIKSDLEKYFNNITGEVLRYKEIIATVIDSMGVKDFETLTLNNDIKNIIATDEQRVNLGAITYE